MCHRVPITERSLAINDHYLLSAKDTLKYTEWMMSWSEDLLPGMIIPEDSNPYRESLANRWRGEGHGALCGFQRSQGWCR
jgi:hypothetical protein